jgi:hypothetical protein
MYKKTSNISIFSCITKPKSQYVVYNKVVNHIKSRYVIEK